MDHSPTKFNTRPAEQNCKFRTDNDVQLIDPRLLAANSLNKLNPRECIDLPLPPWAPTNKYLTNPHQNSHTTDEDFSLMLEDVDTVWVHYLS